MNIVSKTKFPQVTNCTGCDNLLVNRQDEMPTYRVQVQVSKKVRRTIEWLCEPCGLRNYPFQTQMMK